MKLRWTRVEATPPFWSRYAARTPDGTEVGSVEKRGMSSPWYALAADHSFIATRCRTKRDAQQALIDSLEVAQ